MKNYIFITDSVQRVGGVELYISSKKKYLESIGWRVIILSSPITNRRPIIQNLRDSLFYIHFSLNPFNLNTNFRNKCLLKVIKKIKINRKDNTIIESHNDKASPWAELLAKDLCAKHIVVLLDEIQLNRGVCYGDYQHFYDYKFSRKEFLGVRNVKTVLSGYRDIDDSQCVHFYLDESPVADVDEKKVNRIQCLFDMTICYIGRTNKGYVPTIIKEVSEFCCAHPQKKFQFIILGKSRYVKKLLRIHFSSLRNVKVVLLGELVPIPRLLFSKVDVVVAGSGSACCAAKEGKVTIAADVITNKAIGVLGYNTQSSVWKDPDLEEVSFKDALEEVFSNWKSIEERIDYQYRTVEECCQQNFQAILSSCQKKEYYDFEYEKLNIQKSMVSLIKCFFSLYLPSAFLFFNGLKLMIKRIVKRG